MTVSSVQCRMSNVVCRMSFHAPSPLTNTRFTPPGGGGGEISTAVVYKAPMTLEHRPRLASRLTLTRHALLIRIAKPPLSKHRPIHSRRRCRCHRLMLVLKSLRTSAGCCVSLFGRLRVTGRCGCTASGVFVPRSRRCVTYIGPGTDDSPLGTQ